MFISTHTLNTIVAKIIVELTGRSGFGNAWDECDEDIQEEIKLSIYNIILTEVDPR